ncbi:MAG: helix-turn-helix domain-containing protein [Planctomycetota bacterium]
MPGITQQVCHPGLHPDLIGRQRRLSQDLLRTPPHRLGAIAILLQQWVVDLHYRLWRDDDTVTRAIEEACVRLADEDARTLSMPQLAAAVGLGYSTFRTRFKAHTGLSPAAYRIRLLMNTAQHLLSSTRDDCSDIAKQLGYPDLYSFSSQFKQVVGVSPSQWRRSGG